jgi:hypothetical protein
MDQGAPSESKSQHGHKPDDEEKTGAFIADILRSTLVPKNF